MADRQAWSLSNNLINQPKKAKVRCIFKKSEISKYGTYVGTSLGYCIADILKGKISLDRVVGMETHTAIKDESDLIKVLKQYCTFLWSVDSKEDVYRAVKITYTLFFNKPFFQSRLSGGYSIADSQKNLWMFAHQMVTLTDIINGPFKPRYLESTIDRKAKKTTEIVVEYLKKEKALRSRDERSTMG